ncbi:tdh [Symbiodinium natans]|uniref:Tdh protein n=1 Tax=Symbiodinium natans TaxID=878477 RepID=A0A812UQQ9_9DINO|nr:tdh [Symbiodinium natans]
MDGVLYKHAEVERDIVKRLGKATEQLGLGPEGHQDLFRSHGSTIQGLLSEGHLSGDAVEPFYSGVYDGVNLEALKPDPLLALQLKSLRADDVCVWLATNSPRPFVDRVLQALGLESHLLRIVCPSSENGWVNKPDARFFEMLPRTQAKFFDDSLGHVRAAVAAGLPAVHVRRSDDVMMLVADALMVVPACWRLSKSHYLQAKEVADLRSLSAPVRSELAQQLSTFAGQDISVLDLGAGTLSMLSVILKALPKGSRVKYTAVDRDDELLKQAAAERLESQFQATAHASLPNTWQLPDREVSVTLLPGDAVEVLATLPSQTLVVGCSILDLIDVEALSTALRQHQASALLYFPIHYAGVTVFESPRQADVKLLTADYNRSLECRGQVTKVTDFYDSLGETIATGSSDWVLDSKACPDLFKQLASFMAVNALGFHGHAAVGEAVAALRSPGGLLAEDVVLKVENMDYLGRVPGSATAAPRRLAVEFSAPGEVCLVEEALRAPGEEEVVVKARYSAISAGTERRMLMQGPGTEPLDTTHAFGETAWPFRYGYCLVGSVVQSNCGDLLPGTRVFCFHPHASHAVAPRSAVKKIPDDISDEDAVFLANMETACALSQDAAPLVGESVAVFGAGTVGALTAAVLAHQGYSVTVIDPETDRVATLLQRFPQISCSAGKDFDVCVEVSGSADALGSAIKSCRRGGTVVLGSLYGESPVSLPLGLAFHRSEVSLKASQVSQIPAALSTRWTKERRFDLAWSLIRALRPKEWIGMHLVPITAAPDVYRDLMKQGQVPGPDGPPRQWVFSCQPDA